jgi:hypothetical protein
MGARLLRDGPGNAQAFLRRNSYMSAWDSDAGPGLRPGFSSSPPAAIMLARQVEMADGVDAEARLELSMHIGQEWTRSRMDPLLFPIADNASVVQAVSLYDHQSRGRSVFDRKDQFHVPCALHG